MQFNFVTKANEYLFRPEMEALFRARHVVCAEELAWVPVSADRLEIDPFDTPDAAYLIVSDDSGIVAGSRLVPTHLPHLLSERFPNSCNLLPLPRDPFVVEWTRGFVVPNRREGAGLVLKAQCCAAVWNIASIELPAGRRHSGRQVARNLEAHGLERQCTRRSNRH
jgi:acyl-homoserine lactone synthase